MHKPGAQHALQCHVLVRGWLAVVCSLGILCVACGGESEPPTHRRYTTCAFIDVDGDGDDDLFLGQIAGAKEGIDSPSVHDDILLNDGLGNFRVAPQSLPNRSGGIAFGTVSAEAADLDGDGALDLVLSRVDDTHLGGAGVQLLQNDGSGAFTDVSVGIAEPFNQQRWITWVDPVDVDGDGSVDLAISVGGERSLILRSRGDGTYAAHREHLDLIDFESGRVLLGDLNGDANADLLFIQAGATASRIHVLENTTSAPGVISWSLQPEIDAQVRSPDGALIDWDNDGDLDLIVTDFVFLSVSSDGFRFYRNDGNFNFVDASAQTLSNGPVSVEHPRDYVVADFTGDGAADFFVADHGVDQEPFAGTQNRLLIQGASGTMTEEAESRLGVRSGFTHGACAADVDNDGDIDLLTTDLNAVDESGVVLSMNDGRGLFSPRIVELPSSP